MLRNNQINVSSELMSLQSKLGIEVKELGSNVPFKVISC